jgi:hypothetical protein
MGVVEAEETDLGCAQVALPAKHRGGRNTGGTYVAVTVFLRVG